MAYETGSATGPNDMLIKLRDFAAAQGWTVNRDVAAGSGRELCLSKGTAYFNLRSYQNENITINGSGASGRYGIAINGSDGYAGGSAWDRQPGYPLRSSGTIGVNNDHGHANLPLPIYFGPFPSYHLFAPDSKTIYLELEVASNIFQRLGFGSLDLFNPSAPGGGRFFYATGGGHPSTSTEFSWLGTEIDNTAFALEEVPFRGADINTTNDRCGSFLRAAFDSFDNWCGSGLTSTSSYQPQSCQGGGCHDKVLRDYSPNPLNGVGILLPNIVSVVRGNEYLNPVGIVPGMRYMDMTLYQPGEEFSLGTDVWKVFPWYQKGGRSWQRGIAYKKVT